MSSKRLKLLATALLATAPACGMNEGAALETTSSALLNQDTYLYFRCNATSYNLDATTRLRSSVDPYLFTLVFDVKQDWMVNGSGDSCIFTETDQLNGWGTSTKEYGARGGSVAVPGGSNLILNGGHFAVKYPSLGRYKVTANWRDGGFTIARLAGAEAWEPCMNEQVTTIAETAAASSTMAAGCSNGDIFLTFSGKDAVPTWTKIDSWQTSAGTFGLPDLAVNALAFSPKDSKTLYAAVAGSKQGHKLWKTATGGQSWMELSGITLGEIWSISVNPLDTNRVYVTGPGNAVAASADGGNTWTATAETDPLQPPLAAGASISAVAVGNNLLSQVWVGATNGDLFLSTNATDASPSWIKLGNTMPGAPALPAGRAVTRLHTNPTVMWPPEVYATFEGMLQDSVWVSGNGGQSWVNKHNAKLPTTPVVVSSYALYGVSINPVDGNVLYVNGTYGAARSTDRGTSWTWFSN